MKLILAILASLFAPCLAVAAQDVSAVFLNSDPVIAVHSNFRGQMVTLFGNIELGENAPEGPYSVVVLIQGPSSDWIVREKERQAGLVLNSTSASYDQAPSYYAILSSGPLDQIMVPEITDQNQLSFAGLAARARHSGDARNLDAEFVRLMRASDHFVEGEHAVVLHSRTAFSARVPIAPNAVNGLYVARALVIADGHILAETTTRFAVRTEGFERYVAKLAHSNPTLYGLATILLALGTGWLGGVLFKR